MLLATRFPDWIKPEIIPGLPIRWYGLMYFVAFAIAWALFSHQVKRKKYPISEDDVSGLFFWGILGLILGARIFATLVYDTSGIYLQKPWLIFWPFNGKTFVGLQGMSYHGGVIGCAIGVITFLHLHKISKRDILDFLCAAIPLGFTFGRLGNFINGELYGRVTASPIGMIFPLAEGFSPRLEWVRDIAERAGVAIASMSGLVNLPRHPSQLYEALFEGIVLWAILWFLRNRKPFRGFITGAYLVGFGFFRFVIEYFREPDTNLGYRIELVKTDLPPALFSSVFNLSTGQVLCLIMILIGSIWLFIAARLPQELSADPSESELATKRTAEQEEAARLERNKRRKLRKRIG